MPRRVLVIALALFGVLFGAAAMTPDRWAVAVERVVAAPPATVWARASDPAGWAGRGGLCPPGEGCVAALDGDAVRWERGRSRGSLRLEARPGEGRVVLGGIVEGRAAAGELALRAEGDGTRAALRVEGGLGWDPVLRLLRPVFEGVVAEAADAALARLAAEAEAAPRPPEPHPDAPVGTLHPAEAAPAAAGPTPAPGDSTLPAEAAPAPP